MEPSDIPGGEPGRVMLLSCHEVPARIKKIRKSKSMVQVDIFPQLMTECSDFFALPITHIFNLISYVWPTRWKEEFITVIQKNSLPRSLGDLRNISCTTLLASKIFKPN